LNNPKSKGKIPTKMCSRFPDAVEMVKAFAETSLGFDAKIVPYNRFHEIAQHQNSAGEDWVKAAYLILVIFGLAELYSIMR
jgi:hypothetical protein